MGGGIMQLATQACTDTWLTSQPQITFWRGVYRRYANFAYETVDEPILAPRFGSKTCVNISNVGDLLGRMYVRMTLSGGTAPSGATWAWVRRVGHEILEAAELSIGGQTIDKHYSTWANIWYDLTHDKDKDQGYQQMIGNIPEATDMKQTHSQTLLYVPLKFFFCVTENTPLPIIGLQHTNIKIDITFKDVEKLICTSGFTSSSPGAEMDLRLTDATLVTEVVYLEPEDRKTYLQNATEILIHTLQHHGRNAITKPAQTIDIAFHHIVKELVWATRLGKYVNPTGQYKFLAYHATDIESIRLLASKRFALSLAKYDASGELILANNMLVPRNGIPVDLLAKFNSIDAAAVTTSPTIDNISVLGNLLSLEDVSKPAEELLAGTSRPTSGDGRALFDVVVRMPDNFGLYIDRTGNPLATAIVSFNGIQRVNRDNMYFNKVQPLQHHSQVPQDGIYVYSFAVKPESWQPSGGANFSALTSSTLNVGLVSDDFDQIFGGSSETLVFGTNYNLLRIMGGQAGLAYNM